MNEDQPDSDDERIGMASSAPPPRAELPDGVVGMGMSAAPQEPDPVPSGVKPDPYIGCTIDNRYKVEDVIGEGGMGVVYRCRHKIIDKRVAIKILRADLARDAEVTQRFLMEAKAASAIHDEHIISITDFGQLPDGAAYFVMEFLEGTPLSTLAGAGPMGLQRLIGIALQLAEGLAAAHEMGIVHRDLKPDNVFLIARAKEPDFVKILDFGIAKVSTQPQGRLTQVGSVFGTPHYMSPEQASGSALDQRGDIYSLGIMLYELATGQVPFDAENFVGILSQQLYQAPIPPSQRNPEVKLPPQLERIILKCLEKRPEDRYQSMTALRDDLQTLSEGGSHASEPARSIEGATLSMHELPFRPKRRGLTYAAIAVPIAAVGLIFASRLGDSAPAATEAPARATQEETATAGADDALPVEETAADPDEPPPVQVLLGASPPSAHVFEDGIDLGQPPVAIDVRPGEVVQVVVQHPDYEEQTLDLDGTRERVSIELTSKRDAARKRRLARKRARERRERAEARRKSASVKNEPEELGGQLFVEPWQKP